MATESAIDIARKALELAEKATPGPWTPDDCYYGPEYTDSEFIAFARTALLILAKAVIEAAEREPPAVLVRELRKVARLSTTQETMLYRDLLYRAADALESKP